MPLDLLEATHTPEQIMGWMAYYRLEPFGTGVEAVRHAELCHLIVSLAGGKSTVQDFLPDE